MVSILLLTHVIGDFLLQTHDLATDKIYKKNDKKTWIIAQLKHISIHLAVLAFLFVTIGASINLDLVYIIGIYIASHFLLDIIKSVCKTTENDIGKLIIFLLDQIAHFIVIYILYQLLIENVFSIQFGRLFYIFKFNTELFIEPFNILFMSLYIVLVGGVFVPLSLNTMYTKYLTKYGVEKVDKGTEKNDNEEALSIGRKISELSIEFDLDEITDSNKKEEYKYLYLEVSVGKYIGMMERLLIFIGLLCANYNLIIGVIGIKTWVRHKEFSKRSFSEYYLLGSMLSIVFSFIAFYTINSIFELFVLPFTL